MLDNVTRLLLEEASVNPGALSPYTLSAAATSALNTVDEMHVTILRLEGRNAGLNAIIKDIRKAVGIMETEQ